MLRERPIIGVLVALLLVGFVANIYHVRQQYSLKGIESGLAPRARHGVIDGAFDEMVSSDNAATTTPPAVVIVDGDASGKRQVFVQTTLSSKDRGLPPARLPPWLAGIKLPSPAATKAAQGPPPAQQQQQKPATRPPPPPPPPATKATEAPKPTTPSASSAEVVAVPKGKWPLWQDLPVACRPSPASKPTVKVPFEEFAKGKDGSDKVDIAEVNEIEQLPERYYTRVPFADGEFTRLPQYLSGGKDNDKSKMLFDKFLEERPDSHVLYCFPWGIGVDNTVAGPMSRPATVEPDDTVSLRKFLLYFRKFWYAKPGDVGAIRNNKAEIIDVPGMVVQLSGWTAFVFNHFALDSMIRLSMVIDRLKSDDPLWGSAKVMAAITPVQEKKVDGSWRQPQPEEMKVGAYWVWKRLGLTDRIIPATGWAYKTIAAYRAEYLVLPDVYPHPTCGGMGVVKDPWFPRGSLLPLQRHLGVLDPSIKRNLVIWAGRDHGMRSLDKAHEKVLQDEVKKAIAALNKRCPSLDYEFVEFHHDNPKPDGGDWHDFELFKRAVMVFGPHGQQLWNHAFAGPDTVVIEFTSLTGLDFVDTRKSDDCRHCGWALANAAGHNYWIEEPDSFSFFRGGIKPNIDRVMSIVRSAFQNVSKSGACK